MKKIYDNQQINRQLYQQGYKVQDQVVPQGIAFFSTTGKRHYPDFQRGELESYQGMQHLFDPPKRLAQDYDRSLNTKDIDGAVTNTLRSKVVKNLELAQAYKQEKQKSLWEQNSKRSDLDPQSYQARKKWDENDPYKNRSAIYTYNDDSKRKLDDLSEKHIESIQYPDSINYKPNQQYNESQNQKQLYAQSYDDPNLIAERQHLQNQQLQNQQQIIQIQNSQSQPNLIVQPQITQPSNQSDQIQQYQQAPLYQYSLDDERQKQSQILMQKQWEQQRIENLQRLQQQQNNKIIEQQNLKIQQDQDYKIIQEQRQQSLNQKQQYARDLRQQQESNKEVSFRKGFTPPPASKSEIIGSLLQHSKQQKSQGFDGDQNIRDSLSKEIEENERRMVINRFRPHELQQYIYDMKNGRIGGSKTRNNPTFMSYAGQQLVNPQQ
ncbi:unnamed protein product [Paramecium sonneborni]|uniref:Uncharacterized protein n=1 Tax=Paramecium sonneborni TaxID=65129 RepID=A0A8S1RCF4_9CILI|nr:unnamed protein product [Paramecium sonneborni]